MQNKTQDTKPRVAVVLYGMLRTFEVCAPSLLKNVVDANSADLFYFGPSVTDKVTHKHNGQFDIFGHFKFNPKQSTAINGYINEEALVTTYGSALKRFKLHNLNQAIFEEKGELIERSRWLFGLNPSRIYSMFFNIQEAMKLLSDYEVENGIRYDGVILTRPDLVFYSTILYNLSQKDPYTIKIPCGEGFDGFGIKHNGNARVFYYKNVEKAWYVPGGGLLGFNDQILMMPRESSRLLENLYDSLDGYLINHVPISPETILYLHMVSINKIRYIEDHRWLYEIYRSEAKEIMSLLDTDELLFVDRNHPNAKLKRKKHPVLSFFRDLKQLIRLFINRILR
jgi:hypothetical protein